MRTFDSAARAAVQKVIDDNNALLAATSGFVAAEPGFPVVNGAVLREPAIIVFVAHKRPEDSVLAEDRAPRQIGLYRVAVMQASPERQLAAAAAKDQALDLVAAAIAESAEGLTYEPPADGLIDQEYEVSQPLLCHLGPDAGWPVLRPFLEAAEATLSVAIYDFNADYVAKTFIECVRKPGFAGALTWDDSMTAAETEIRKRLRAVANLNGVIVQCGGGRRFASAYHEKVAVRDSSAFWLSSGNWSLRSQPNIDPVGVPAQAKGMYAKGNREWHVIVEDEELSKQFELYIKHDLKGSQEEAQAGDTGAVLEAAESLRMPDLFVPLEELQRAAVVAASVAEPTAPASLPSDGSTFTIQPLLTPDNYVGRITRELKKVRRSVYLQFAYINYSEKAADREFREMLQVLADLSWKPGIDVRIIVGSNDAADKIRVLAEAGFNDKVFRRQSNVHNKGIVFDGSRVLISSANWSGDGVLRNRDAGLLVFNREVAQYYQTAFRQDWDERASSLLEDDMPVLLAREGEPTPEGMVRMSWRDYYS